MTRSQRLKTPCICSAHALEKIEHYTIPGTDITHAAVVIEKIKPTHPKYPRKWAQIKKNML